jgi:hypothetical protein
LIHHHIHIFVCQFVVAQDQLYESIPEPN